MLYNKTCTQIPISTGSPLSFCSADVRSTARGPIRLFFLNPIQFSSLSTKQTLIQCSPVCPTIHIYPYPASFIAPISPIYRYLLSSLALGSMHEFNFEEQQPEQDGPFCSTQLFIVYSRSHLHFHSFSVSSPYNTATKSTAVIQQTTYAVPSQARRILWRGPSNDESGIHCALLREVLDICGQNLPFREGAFGIAFTRANNFSH